MELQSLQQSLIAVSQSLPDVLTPLAMKSQLFDHGEEAWIEKLWLEDYTRYFQGLDV